MKTLISLLAAFAAGPAIAEGCSAASPAHTVALVELFTSQGCSSCPPADRFLGSLRGAGLQPAQAVLMSLHVDYWNNIGWKDPYSRKLFTERQRWLSDLARSRTIYTPEFFVGGRELRDWSGQLADKVKSINAAPARAAIAIDLAPIDADGIALQARASGAPGAVLQVALLESGIATQVKSGENSGRMLRHDHVVREWLPPVTLGSDGKALLSRMVQPPSGARKDRLTVAAFVQTGAGEVLQALSRAVCAGKPG